MLVPKAASFLYTSPPWAAVTLCPAWDQPCLVLGVLPQQPQEPSVPQRDLLLAGLQGVAGTGSRTPLTYHTLSSHALIFAHFKSCLLESHLPTTTLSPLPFLF